MKRAPAILVMSVWLVACADDGRLNPPPERATAEGVSAPVETVTDTHATLQPPIAVAPDLARRARVGAQEVITLQLSDALVDAAWDLPRDLGTGPVLAPNIHNYRNPWAKGRGARFRYRLAWIVGNRNQWDMRNALVFPNPTRVTWHVKVPAAASVRFGLALATRDGSKVPLETRVMVGDEVLFVDRRGPTDLDDMELWEPVSVDLGAFAGREVALSIDCRGASEADTLVLLAEPRIITGDPDAAKAATGLAAADNILWVVVDAQRADTLPPLSQKHHLGALFPTMESLVAHGTTFTDSHSVGNQTRLSTFAFLASQRPRFGRFFSKSWDLSAAFKHRYYAADPPLLPRLMRRLGYRTLSVGNDAFLFGNQAISLDAGWDAVTDHRNSTRDTPWMSDTVIGWLERHHNERFFVMLNYNAPHWRYDPPDESWLPFKPKLEGQTFFKWPYLGEIKWVDQHLARVMAALDRLGLRKSTLVVFISDHGEIMDRGHDCWSKTMDYDCLWSHGATVYDEELHVPMVWRQPGRIPSGQVVDAPFSQIDIAPTLLSLIGARPIASQQGRDFSAAVLGQGPAPAEVPRLAEARFSTALTFRNLKYTRHEPELRTHFLKPGHWDPADGLEEFYDLHADPNEHRNLITSGDPRIEELRDRLAALRTDEAHAHPTWTTFRLHGGAAGAHFEGRLQAEGRFVGIEAWPPGSAERAHLLPGGHAIAGTWDVAPGAVVGFRVNTWRPDAPIAIKLLLDGEQLPAERLYLGAFGLALADTPRIDDFAALSSPVGGPPVAKGTPAGLFAWRAEAGQGGDALDAAPLDASVRNMMKDWGYH